MHVTSCKILYGDYMNTEQKILEILENTDGAVSGQELANDLNISRNAVWKSINSLRKSGYIIDAYTNKGYEISYKNSIMSETAVKKALKTDCKILLYKTVTSTNTLAKRAAEAGENEFTVIIAENQTDGRGRLGRKFYSPALSGLYISIVLRPSLPAHANTLITTAAAVAVSKAINSVFGVNTDIKWVNDIFLHGKKVCGILTEGSFNIETGNMDYAVLGIGVNLTAPSGGFPADIKNIAGEICKGDCSYIKKAEFTAAIIDNFAEIYKKLPEKDFMNYYRSHSLILGKRVGFICDGKEISATAINIDDDAHLTVKLPDGTLKVLSAGEVSLKI